MTTEEEEDGGTVFSPNMRPEDTGLMCFMDAARPCGAECMAFTMSEKSPALSLQQSSCVLLVGVERMGRFTGGLVSLLRKKTADEARTGTSAPPSPLGKS